MFHKILAAIRPWIGTVVVGGCTIVALITWGRWYPRVENYAQDLIESRRPSKDADEENSDEKDSAEDSEHVDLTPEAIAELGLNGDGSVRVQRSDFVRTVSIPAIVVERTAQARVAVAAPLTCVVTGIHAVEGETVDSGHKVFTLQLTHEDLVAAQAEYLKLLGQLDVEQQEIDRLTTLSERGSIAGRTLIERQYEKLKLQAAAQASREALLLHGLTDEHVREIERQRRLKRQLVLTVPTFHSDGSIHSHMEEAHSGAAPVGQPVSHRNVTRLEPSEHQQTGAGKESHRHTADDHAVEGTFVVEQINVHVGQFVQAGTNLCELADFRQLYIEGRAFEQDLPLIERAIANDWSVTAVPGDDVRLFEPHPDLPIVYVSNRIDEDSRALHFYVALENELLRNTAGRDGRQRQVWRFRPGQRMRLRIPVETWSDRFVLPVDAVARDGLDSYVFARHGDHFDRISVAVEHRDQLFVVLSPESKLKPGTRIAYRSAQQLLMALQRSKSSGADAHHGHTH